MNDTNENNPLGYEKLSVLLKRFAIPSIIAMVVSSLYNIVDQIFIGQGVGYLGNAATNVAFPLTTICLAITLLISIGSASRFSLSLGEGDATPKNHLFLRYLLKFYRIMIRNSQHYFVFAETTPDHLPIFFPFLLTAQILK